MLKLSGTERAEHRGPARVFDSEEQCFDAVQRQTIKPGDVVVIRYEGPHGGPGMREMLAVTAAIIGAGLGESVAAADRRPLLGRDARPLDRPHRARGVARRPDRRRSARATSIVLDVAKRHAERRAERRRDRRRGSPAWTGAGAALQDRRDGEIRAAGVVGVDRSGHRMNDDHRRARRDRRANYGSANSAALRRECRVE